MYYFVAPVIPHTDIDYPLNNFIQIEEGGNYILNVTTTKCSKPPVAITWETTKQFKNISTYKVEGSCHSDPNITTYGKAESIFEVKDVEAEQSDYLILTFNHPSFTREQTVIYTIQIKGKFYVQVINNITENIDVGT